MKGQARAGAGKHVPSEGAAVEGSAARPHWTGRCGESVHHWLLFSCPKGPRAKPGGNRGERTVCARRLVPLTGDRRATPLLAESPGETIFIWADQMPPAGHWAGPQRGILASSLWLPREEGGEEGGMAAGGRRRGSAGSQPARFPADTGGDDGQSQGGPFT